MQGFLGQAEFGEDGVDVFSTVDAERWRDCSMPALVLPWAISRRTSSSRAVRVDRGECAVRVRRVTSDSTTSGSMTEPPRVTSRRARIRVFDVVEAVFQ